MRKIKLEVEQLRVESFGTATSVPPKGTVYGRDYTDGQQCATVHQGEWGCQNSGVASCVWCPAETQTCQDCSWTVGDGVMCHW